MPTRMTMIHLKTIWPLPRDYNEHLDAYEGMIRAVSLERGIKHGIGIAVDEWGLSRFLRIWNDIPCQCCRDEWGVCELLP